MTVNVVTWAWKNGCGHQWFEDADVAHNLYQNQVQVETVLFEKHQWVSNLWNLEVPVEAITDETRDLVQVYVDEWVEQLQG